MSADLFLWLLSFLVLLLYALVFAERGVNPALAPLAAVCAVIVGITVFGCFGVLAVGAWVYTLGGLLALGWLVYRWAVKKRPLPRFSFGFWLFVALSVGSAVLLAARAPEFSTWDEYSFWGTAQKLARLYDEFHVTAPVGWNWVQSQTPALISLGYALGYWCVYFEAWQVYAAVNLLLFACVCALTAPLGRKWQVAAPVAAVALLVPYLLTLYREAAQVTSVYLDSLGDVPMGMLFGAGLCLAVWPGRRIPARLVPLCLILMALTLTKDQIGLLLSLVVAGVVLCLALFQKRPAGVGWAKHILRAAGLFLLLAACAAAANQGWSAYVAAVRAGSRDTLGGANNMSLTGMLVALPRDLLLGGNAHFNNSLRAMWDIFFVRTTMLGSGFVVVCAILLLVAFAAVIARSKALRRRCIVYAAATTLAFLAYSLVILASYAYILREEQLLESYERYMYPYYIGWFLGALALVGLAAKRSRFIAEGRLALVALALLCGVRVGQFVPVQLSIIGFDTSEYAVQRAFAARAQEVAGYMREEGGGLLFIVSPLDVGERWFQYCYYLLPNQVDYSFGGGSMVEEVKQADGSFLQTEITAALWPEYLLDKGCTMVLVDTMTEDFRAEYGHLFTDGLASTLYRVVPSGGSVVLEPVA